MFERSELEDLLLLLNYKDFYCMCLFFFMLFFGVSTTFSSSSIIIFCMGFWNYFGFLIFYSSRVCMILFLSSSSKSSIRRSVFSKLSFLNYILLISISVFFLLSGFFNKLFEKSELVSPRKEPKRLLITLTYLI